MKTRMKKWLSLILATMMMFVAISALAVTASAEEGEYTDVPANTTVNVNGVNIRYDRYSGNDDGYVHVMSDGTIEFKIRHGDMVWFPDVVMTANSAVHAEVTALSDLTNIFPGLAYDVKATTADSHWATAMVQVYKTAGRYRITPATYENLGKISGGDRGNGGDSPRVVDAFYTSTEKDTDAYKALVNGNNDWAQDKTASFDLSMSGGMVSVTWGVPNLGEILTYTYADSEATYSFAGGAVGFTPVWTSTDNYITMRFEALAVTNCTVAGENTTLFCAVGNQITVDGETTFVAPGNDVKVSDLQATGKKLAFAVANGQAYFIDDVLDPSEVTDVTTFQVTMETQKVSAVETTGLKYKSLVSAEDYAALIANELVASVEVGTIVAPTASVVGGDIKNATGAKVISATYNAATGSFENEFTVAKADRDTSYSGVGFVKVTFTDGKTVELFSDYKSRLHAYALSDLVEFEDEEPENTTQKTQTTTAPAISGSDSTDEPEEESSGCFGAVNGVSVMVSVLALAGCSVLFRRKKNVKEK